ncbi:MAG: sigma-70 family RNA polymerase sigma factor [Muribaculaceae bacterium]|nr:sigma-70 family RNA polymerase sigma factor [Muribaculaceae bacterium]
MDDINREKEFEDAVNLYGDLINRICLSFSADTEEFKDLRQEVLFNIWKGWEHFLKNSKTSTWIYRVSFNTCISFQRKEKKFKKTLPLENVLDKQAEETLQTVEKYKTLFSLIRMLSYNDRVILLMWLDEKNYEEISDLTGLNRNTVATRLKRIKEKLVKMNNEI